MSESISQVSGSFSQVPVSFDSGLRTLFCRVSESFLVIRVGPAAAAVAQDEFQDMDANIRVRDQRIKQAHIYIYIIIYIT